MCVLLGFGMSVVVVTLISVDSLSVDIVIVVLNLVGLDISVKILIDVISVEILCVDSKELYFCELKLVLLVAKEVLLSCVDDLKSEDDKSISVVEMGIRDVLLILSVDCEIFNTVVEIRNSVDSKLVVIKELVIV